MTLTAWFIGGIVLGGFLTLAWLMWEDWQESRRWWGDDDA